MKILIRRVKMTEGRQNSRDMIAYVEKYMEVGKQHLKAALVPRKKLFEKMYDARDTRFKNNQ